MNRISNMSLLVLILALASITNAQTDGATSASNNKTKNYNPDISVIADFIAGYAWQGDENKKDVAMREVELVIGGDVDTWGKYYLTATIHNHPELELTGHNHEDAHDHAGETEPALTLEEAYFLYLDLPADLQLKVGKFRTNFGKKNTMHPHSLAWIDYPMVIQSYLGEEGLIGTGASVSWLAPLDLFTEFTYDVVKLQGEGEFAMSAGESDDFAHLGRAKLFTDISTSTSLELGGSTLLAPFSDHDTDFDFNSKWLNGIDVTMKWKSNQNSYRYLEWNNEFFFLRSDIVDHHAHDGEDEDHEDEHDEELERQQFFGFYSSLSYRKGKSITITGRYDQVESLIIEEMEETMLSLYLTWHQSEYAYWRIGLQRLEADLHDLSLGPEHRLMAQFSVTLGPHPAHRY